MDTAVIRERLNVMYVAWQQQRPVTHMPRKARHQGTTFSYYVLRRDPELYEAVSLNLEVLSECSADFRRDWHGLRHRPIGTETLKKYMGEISARFLHAGTGVTLEQYLNHILEKCATEKQLRAFLRK